MNPTIELRLPAAAELVSLLRTISGAAAARSDLTLDLLDDSKIACSEAAILLINHAAPNADFAWSWACSEKRLDIRASAPTLLKDLPDFSAMEGFTWTVFSAVAKNVVTELVGGFLIIEFSIFETNIIHEA